MKVEKLVVGVIGLGMGRAHLKGAIAYGAEVGLICDPNPDKLKLASEECNVPESKWTTDYMDIVNNKLYFDPDWTKPADLPNPDAGNHMLVTDAEGQTSWAERTHYVEMIPDVVLPEITVTAKSAFLKNYGAYTRNLEKEHTYHIVCDGVEYSCVPTWNESLYGYTIGNAALASALFHYHPSD